MTNDIQKENFLRKQISTQFNCVNEMSDIVNNACFNLGLNKSGTRDFIKETLKNYKIKINSGTSSVDNFINYLVDNKLLFKSPKGKEQIYKNNNNQV